MLLNLEVGTTQDQRTQKTKKRIREQKSPIIHKSTVETTLFFIRFSLDSTTLQSFNIFHFNGPAFPVLD